MRAHGTDAGLEQTEEVAHFCIDRACANVRVCIYTQIPVNGGNSISVCCVCVCVSYHSGSSQETEST